MLEKKKVAVLVFLLIAGNTKKRDGRAFVDAIYESIDKLINADNAFLDSFQRKKNRFRKKYRDWLHFKASQFCLLWARFAGMSSLNPVVPADIRGIEWSHSINLTVLAKFGLCSNCLQKLDECSLALVRKVFATARMLGFSFKFLYGKTEHLGEKCTRYECFWKHASGICWRFIGTEVHSNSPRKAPAK